MRADPAAAWRARPYPQLLRGPGHRWWRPLLGLAVALGCLLAIVVGSLVAWLAGAVVAGADPAAELDAASPWVLLLTNLGLAALVPAAQLAVWVGHGWRPRWLSSVAGGLRWGWLAWCTGAALLVALVSTAGIWLVAGRPQGGAEADAALLLLVVLATTPLQAAGEEYAFRGWMTQAIGSLLARAGAAVVVSALSTALLFALAHGSQDPWLFVDRFAFGLLASWLTWRTGGLEAAIAAHAVNNVVVFLPVILSGGLEEALTSTSAPAALVVADVGAMVVLALLVARGAARRGVRRRFEPPPAPLPAVPGTPAGATLVDPHRLR